MTSGKSPKNGFVAAREMTSERMREETSKKKSGGKPPHSKVQSE